MEYSIKLNNLNDTKELAKKLATIIKPKLVIAVFGNLGFGKTTLIREVLYSLNVQGSIKSPTYTLVEEYILAIGKIYHFDLYRFNSPMEWYDSGFDEYLTDDSISFIEWPEKAYQAIGSIDIEIVISMNNNDQRLVNITSNSTHGEECLKQLT